MHLENQLMINFVPFYKDVNSNVITHKKLKRRIGKVDYRKNLHILYESFQLFNPDNNFVVLTDKNTNLPYECYRCDLEDYNLMESIIVANLEYVKGNLGKSVLVGADNVVLDNVNKLFKNKFDLGFYCIRDRNEDDKLNLSNGVILINSNHKNHNKIIDFFYNRYKIYQNYDLKYKSWWGDMLSINHLLQTKNIISDFYNSNKTKLIHDFDGLKIRIFEVGKDHYKWVDSNGNYNKSNNDIILDFPGDNSVKRHAQDILNNLKDNSQRRY